MCVFHFDTGKGTSEGTQNAQFILKGLMIGVKKWITNSKGVALNFPLSGVQCDLIDGVFPEIQEKNLDIKQVGYCKSVKFSVQEKLANLAFRK